MPKLLLPIERPSGSLYRPRKLVAYSVTDDDELVAGAVVFGTHDADQALPLAQEVIDRELGREYVPIEPCKVWWRDGFESGRRAWITDEEHGRAGVWFRDLAERVSE